MMPEGHNTRFSARRLLKCLICGKAVFREDFLYHPCTHVCVYCGKIFVDCSSLLFHVEYDERRGLILCESCEEKSERRCADACDICVLDWLNKNVGQPAGVESGLMSCHSCRCVGCRKFFRKMCLVRKTARPSKTVKDGESELQKEAPKFRSLFSLRKSSENQSLVSSFDDYIEAVETDGLDLKSFLKSVYELTEELGCKARSDKVQRDESLPGPSHARCDSPVPGRFVQRMRTISEDAPVDAVARDEQDQCARRKDRRRKGKSLRACEKNNLPHSQEPRHQDEDEGATTV